MKVLCENCKTVYDTKDGKYEDHESSKCTWTDEDKKDSNFGWLGMFLFIGGLMGGMFATLATNNLLYMVAIGLPTLILSQGVLYKVWTKPTQRIFTNVRAEK